MINPEKAYAGLIILNDLINPSMPPSNPYIQAGHGLNSLSNLLVK